jgi:hypothetical protein
VKHLLTLFCGLGALACYLLSIQTGAGLLLAAGCILEIVFWFHPSSWHTG